MAVVYTITIWLSGVEQKEKLQHDFYNSIILSCSCNRHGGLVSEFVPELEERFQSTGNVGKPAEGCLQDTIYLKGRLRSIDVLYPPRASTPPSP